MKKKLPVLMSAMALLGMACFSLTAFAQSGFSSGSEIEDTGTDLRIEYVFELPSLADSSLIDARLLEKTREVVLRQRNTWPQSYPAATVQEAEALLGMNFLASSDLEAFDLNPNNTDCVRVSASDTASILRTTYTRYRFHNGCSIVLEADTTWDDSSFPRAEYSFSFPKSKYTVRETSCTAPSGEAAAMYEVLDKEGRIVVQCAAFNDGATNYILYASSFDRTDGTGVPETFVADLLKGLKADA